MSGGGPCSTVGISETVACARHWTGMAEENERNGYEDGGTYECVVAHTYSAHASFTSRPRPTELMCSSERSPAEAAVINLEILHHTIPAGQES